MEESTVQKIIIEYLQYQNFEKTLKSFEEEFKLPKKSYKEDELPSLPKIYSYLKGATAVAAREALKEKQFKMIERNYSIVLQAGKQLMALAIDCVQKLENTAFKENIETYKEQLQRHNQIFSSDSRMEPKDTLEAFEDTELRSLKSGLQRALKSKDNNHIKNTLTSFRKSCLSISAKSRRKVVEQIIKHDIFSGNLVLLLRFPDCKIPVLAVLCIYVSIRKGVDSILRVNSQGLILALLEILTNEVPGSVGQRFTLGCLQKISVWNESNSAVLIDRGIINWVLEEILERSIIHKEYMHAYCIDFGSALIANLIASHYGLVYLESKMDETELIMKSMLEMIKGDNVSSCAIMHLLISLTSLCNDKFFNLLESTQFKDKISEFVEFYNSKNREQENESPEDKKVILDMSAHLFHTREHGLSLDTSDVMKYNVENHKQDIEEIEKKFDDESELLVFECFPDEFIAGI
jgi:hypothetical protein